MSTPYELWQLTEKEQEILLGEVIQANWIVVELDEATQRMFYGRRFAPLEINQCYRSHPQDEDTFLRLHLASIDDHSLMMMWNVKKLEAYPYECINKLMGMLQRTNYFVNQAGLEHYCRTIFGKPHLVDYA